MTDAPETIEVEVLADIPNMAVYQGAPFLLLRDAKGRFALGQKIGDVVTARSEWVQEEKIVNGALRVLGGDPKALTHPKAMLHIALALAGIWVAAARAGGQSAVGSGQSEESA